MTKCQSSLLRRGYPRGQLRLAVAATPEMVEIVNQAGNTPVPLEIWGEEHMFEKELIVIKKGGLKKSDQ